MGREEPGYVIYLILLVVIYQVTLRFYYALCKITDIYRNVICSQN